MLQSLELWQQDCYELPFINDGPVHHLRLQGDDVLVFQLKESCSSSARQVLIEQISKWATESLPFPIHMIVLPFEIDLRCVLNTTQAKALQGIPGEVGKIQPQAHAMDQ